MSLRQWESGIVSPAVGFLLGAGLAASKYCRIRVSSLGLFAVRVTFAFFATYSAAT
jgi:hypothetical protein